MNGLNVMRRRGTQQQALLPEGGGDAIAWLKRGRRYLGVGGALIALVVTFGSIHSFFVSGENINNILNTNADLMLVAVGMTFAMVGGGFDLSVGSILVGTAVVLHGLLEAGVPQILAIVLSVLSAALVGALVNGALIAYAKLNFLVVTLGTMSAIQGLAYVVTNGNTLSLQKWNDVTAIGNDSIFGLSYLIWAMIISVALTGVVLRFTRLGRAIYAVGGNREAARIAGIRSGLVTMLTYGASGLFAGMAGIAVAGTLAAASPTEGTNINLIAGAAVLLGGTSFSGGEGGIFGTVLGVLLIGVLQNGLGVVGVSDFWQGVVTGVVLIAAVGLDQFQKASTRKHAKSVAVPPPGGPADVGPPPSAVVGTLGVPDATVIAAVPAADHHGVLNPIGEGAQ